MSDDGKEQTYTAIQCKFYAADKVVSKDDIDFFRPRIRSTIPSASLLPLTKNGALT